MNFLKINNLNYFNINYQLMIILLSLNGIRFCFLLMFFKKNFNSNYKNFNYQQNINLNSINLNFIKS